APRRDRAGGPVAVAQAGRDDEPTLAADLHALHAQIPAPDHLLAAHAELERLAARDRRVEDPPVAEHPGVVHLDDGALHGLVALAHHEIGHLEPALELP